MDEYYWNNTGKYQKLYDDLWDLVPSDGPTGYVELEVLRAISKIAYDFYNNGFGNDWSEPYSYLIKWFRKNKISTNDLKFIGKYRYGRCYKNWWTSVLKMNIENMINQYLKCIIQKYSITSETDVTKLEFTKTSADMYDRNTWK